MLISQNGKKSLLDTTPKNGRLACLTRKIRKILCELTEDWILALMFPTVNIDYLLNIKLQTKSYLHKKDAVQCIITALI